MKDRTGKTTGPDDKLSEHLVSPLLKNVLRTSSVPRVVDLIRCKGKVKVPPLAQCPLE